LRCLSGALGGGLFPGVEQTEGEAVLPRRDARLGAKLAHEVGGYDAA
ncbi:MAG: hypothetical protein QOI06_1440, partial [Nocardioidaceae bacterium]|nr:hypothetical protein [Nocardioidaceae bacterium]